MEKWEYISEPLFINRDENVEIWNKLGREGWELIAFYLTQAIFKRRII